MDSKKNKHKKKNKTRTNEDKRSLSRMCTRGGTPPATGILRSSLIGRDSWRRYSFVSFFFLLFPSVVLFGCSVSGRFLFEEGRPVADALGRAQRRRRRRRDALDDGPRRRRRRRRRRHPQGRPFAHVDIVFDETRRRRHLRRMPVTHKKITLGRILRDILRVMLRF